MMQTIDLVDVFNWRATDAAFRYLALDSVSPDDDLVVRALASANAERWTGDVWIEKHIPLAAGLAGGSSDAALALRLAYPDSESIELMQAAAELGADVPFFLSGGTALATGTGTELVPLRTPDFWVVLIVPGLVIPGKTRLLYSQLEDEDFSDGSSVRALAERPQDAIQRPLPNAFERQMRRYPEVERAWAALARVASGHVTLSGAGLALFTLFNDERQARHAAQHIAPNVGAVRVARTLPANYGMHAVAAMAAALRGALTVL
jgi:4-diphosphocytidyl-2-C-methyl-D-erythritol kinase